MNSNFRTYSAAGNMIGVAYYPELFDLDDFISNLKARKELKDLAIENNCDTVMVLSNGFGDARLQTIVFEPNTGHEGGFSTMCGNGIRAAAAYAEEYLNFDSWPLVLQTRSGLLNVEKISDSIYRVLMGNVITNKRVLGSYVNSEYFPGSEELIDVNIPAHLLENLSGLPFADEARFSIGLNSTETDLNRADGEPHIMIEVKLGSIPDIKDLRRMAEQYGPTICNDKEVFPSGININFIYKNSANSIIVCTFERNLGDDPARSVTQACGTGCTFVCGELMRRSSSSRITAGCLGGRLIIENADGHIYMLGEAARVN